MHVEMKQYEAWCLEYAARFNHKATWEVYCAVKDAYLAGYHKGKEDEILLEGDYLVEVDVNSNQIGQALVNKRVDLLNVLTSILTKIA